MARFSEKIMLTKDSERRRSKLLALWEASEGKLTSRSLFRHYLFRHFCRHQQPGKTRKRRTLMTAGLLRHYERAARTLVANAAVPCLDRGPLHADPIKIGQVAALSGASAQSGEAITRGLTLAIEEINAKGGLLGRRMLELVQRDDEIEPAQGTDRGARTRGRRCRGDLRRHRYAGVARHRAGAQQGKAHLYGRVGGRHRHHAQWRRSEQPGPAFLRSMRWST